MSEKLNDILYNNINIPLLDNPNYASGVNEALIAIKNNFKILASSPFLQGQDGNSVQTDTYNLFTNTGGDKNTWELTYWGVLVFKGLLPDDVVLTENITVGEVYGLIDSIESVNGYSNINSIYHIDSLIDKDTNIEVCTIEGDDGIKELVGMVQPMYVVDARLAHLKDISEEDIYNFKDQSGVLFLKRDGDSFIFEKKNIIPCLYFNSELNTWCWRINGVETNVSAVGIQGDSGENGSKLWMMGVSVPTVNINDDNIEDGTYVVSEIYIDEETNTNCGWKTITDEYREKIDSQDLSMTFYFKNDNGFKTLNDIVISPLYIDSDNTEIKVFYCNKNSIYKSAIRDTLQSGSLIELLKTIKNSTGSDHSEHSRGLWIPTNNVLGYGDGLEKLINVVESDYSDDGNDAVRDVRVGIFSNFKRLDNEEVPIEGGSMNIHSFDVDVDNNIYSKSLNIKNDDSLSTSINNTGIFTNNIHSNSISNFEGVATKNINVRGDINCINTSGDGIDIKTDKIKIQRPDRNGEVTLEKREEKINTYKYGNPVTIDSLYSNTISSNNMLTDNLNVNGAMMVGTACCIIPNSNIDGVIGDTKLKGFLNNFIHSFSTTRECVINKNIDIDININRDCVVNTKINVISSKAKDASTRSVSGDGYTHADITNTVNFKYATIDSTRVPDGTIKITIPNGDINNWVNLQSIKTQYITPQSNATRYILKYKFKVSSSLTSTGSVNNDIDMYKVSCGKNTSSNIQIETPDNPFDPFTLAVSYNRNRNTLVSRTGVDTLNKTLTLKDLVQDDVIELNDYEVSVEEIYNVNDSARAIDINIPYVHAINSTKEIITNIDIPSSGDITIRSSELVDFGKKDLNIRYNVSLMGVELVDIYYNDSKSINYSMNDKMFKTFIHGGGISVCEVNRYNVRKTEVVSWRNLNKVVQLSHGSTLSNSDPIPDWVQNSKIHNQYVEPREPR